MPLRTRLAPTPSGYLHPGNALSFIVTWAIARADEGTLLLRIDDLDKARRRQEYLEDIFTSLDWLQLDYDEGPSGVDDFIRHYSQHQRLDLYEDALRRLRQTGQVYGCTCSRQQIRRQSTDFRYPNTCRYRGLPLDGVRTAWRLLVPDDAQMHFRSWMDSMPASVNLAEMMGDFVVRQKNGLPAYQIASLVDDGYFQINFIVRGEDLLPSSAAQYFIASLLGEDSFLQTTFWHHPLLTDEEGIKLSKSKGAGSLLAWRKAGRSPRELYKLAAAWLKLPVDAGASPENLVAGLREKGLPEKGG